MIPSAEIALVIGFATIIALLVIIVVTLLYVRPETRYERPRKASLPPLHGGYKPLPSEGGRGHQEHPPRAPKGSGGGST